MPNTINTRIQLKYDTLSNWILSSTGTNAFKPLKGEICIAEIPKTNETQGNRTKYLDPPAIGIKVGDGTHTFQELPWIQAIAGDVYSWAKTENKPDYDASEIKATERNGPTNGSTVQAILTAVQNSLATLTGGESGQSIAGQIVEAIQNLDYTDTVETGKFVTSVSETDGVISVTRDNIAVVDIDGLQDALDDLQDALDTKQDNLAFNGTYDASSNKVATESTVSSAISGLTDTLTGTPGAGKTITAFDEVDGKVSATFSEIQITESQVTDLVDDLAKKAPLASPDFSGTPTAPTAAAGTNTKQIATTAFVKNAVDTATAGLSGAMHYRGEVSVIPPSPAPGISYASGDVVVLTSSNKEYVFNGTDWRELGDEGSYALKTITITAGSGLTGGGTLESNRTISHAVPAGATAGEKGQTDGRKYVQKITTDEFGHITGVTTGEETVINTTYTFEEGTTNGAFSVTSSDGNGTAQSVAIHGLGSAAYKDTAAALDGPINSDKLPTAGQVTAALSNKVDKETGKGLSTNDYTTDEKTKLSGIETGAQVNTIEKITVPSDSGTGADKKLTITNKTVKLAKIAETGSIYNVTESNKINNVDFLIFNCGSASTLIDNFTAGG